MNEAYRAALLAERAALEPFAEQFPNKARRLAEVDAQLAPSASEVRAASARTEPMPADLAMPPATANAVSSAPKETAVTRRGKTSKET